MNDMSLMTEALQEMEANPEFERLRHKQEQYCLRYIQHGNGARAAREAGYSKKTAASISCELQQKPEIQYYINVFRDLKRKRNTITIPFLHTFVMSLIKDEKLSVHFKLKVAEGLGYKLATLEQNPMEGDLGFGEDGYLMQTEGIDPVEDHLVYITDTSPELIAQVEALGIQNANRETNANNS